MHLVNVVENEKVLNKRNVLYFKKMLNSET